MTLHVPPPVERGAEWADPEIERDVKRGHIPCCMGCVMYGHRYGCHCLPPVKREVTVPLLAMKRLLDGTATDADRVTLRALVMRELR